MNEAPDAGKRPLTLGKALVWIALLAVLQAGLVALYRGRRPADAPFDPGQELDGGRVPRIAWQRPDGTDGALAPPLGRPVLLHYWATWCPPCRDEAPALLEMGRERGDLDVIAVSLDVGWEPIRAFFDGTIPEQVVLARPGEGEDELGVRELPATFLLGPSGELLRRYDGARPWHGMAAREHLDAELRRAAR